MKDIFFQRFFGRQSQESLRRTRRLSLESLENREMLNVDWAGFGPETTSTYVPAETGSYSVDLPSNVDFCGLVNLEGDSRAELVSIYGKGKTVSVYTSSNDGRFTLKTEQKLDNLGAWGLYSFTTFADFNGDGFKEMLLISSNGSQISASVYSWNSTSSKFEQGSTYQLNVTPFASSGGGFIFTEMSGALLANASNGYDLALQVGTLTQSGLTTTTAVYPGVATTSFGENPSVKGAVTGEILGSTKIAGQSYLLLKEATGSTNYLVVSKIGKSSVTKTYYDFTSYGSKFVFNSMAEQDGFIVVGAILGGTTRSGLVTLNLTTAPTDNETVDAKTLGQWIESPSITMGPASVMTLGDVGGDADPELLVANDEENASLFYLGDASTTYGFTFTESSLVVSSPEYNSVYVGDYDNDAKKEAILVGSNYIYVADISDSGQLTNQTARYKFSQPVEKAVFGYFDDDRLLDIAVQYKANVGSSLQIFRQIYDGSFVPLTSQSVSGSFVDLTVGKFTQTLTDEIAVLSTAYKNQTTWSSVNVYKLDSSKNTLVGVLASTYAGSGVSIASGELYGSGRDDLAVANEVNDSVMVLRNSGSSLSQTLITTRYDGSDPCRPTSAAIGDFNGDGLADLAVMNSSAGSNVAEVVYYLRSASVGLGTKPTGRVRINNTLTVVDNTAIVGELLPRDLNGDGYFDLSFVRKSTNGTAYVSTLMGNGTASVFDPLINAAVTCDPVKSVGVLLAPVDSGNASDDFIWVQDKKFTVLMNGATTVSGGKVQYVMQNVTAGAGNSLAAAVSTQPTWLDEWSNFYIDVWASPSGGGAVASVSGSFTFDSAYFAFSEVGDAAGFTVTATAEGGTLSFTSTGSGTADADGWTLVARLKFSPVTNGGLPLNEFGEIYCVDAAFTAGANAQKVNGSAAASVAVPTGVEVYPFVYDLNDNGEVDLGDYALFCSYYPASTLSEISVVKHRVLDVNNNNEYELGDYAYALASYPLLWNHGGDYSYQVKPVVTSGSGAVFESSAFVEEEEAFFVDDSDVEAIAEEIVASVARTVEQRIASTSQAAERPVFYGPMTKAEALKFDLSVDLGLDF
jgi:hypothetical protein